MNNLSEEEKRAIEIFDGFIKKDKDEISEIEQLESDYYDEELDLLKRRVKWFTILLNLIDKQQKEKEELKKDKKALVDNYNKVLGSFISKDKIREKIKEITEYYEKEVKPEMYHWGDFSAEEHYADIIAKYNELLEE